MNGPWALNPTWICTSRSLSNVWVSPVPCKTDETCSWQHSLWPFLSSPTARVNYRQWRGPCLQCAKLIWPDCLPSANGLCGRIPWDRKYVGVNWGRLKNRPAFRHSSNSQTSPSCSRQKIKNDQYPNHFFPSVALSKSILVIFLPLLSLVLQTLKESFSSDTELHTQLCPQFIFI